MGTPVAVRLCQILEYFNADFCNHISADLAEGMLHGHCRADMGRLGTHLLSLLPARCHCSKQH